jgi:hypothetical protein
VQPPVHYCGQVAAAEFKVAFPGLYHVEVLQLYEGFSYAAPAFGMADIHAASHAFVATAPGTLAAGTTNGQSPCCMQSRGAQNHCQGPAAAPPLDVNSSRSNSTSRPTAGSDETRVLDYGSCPACSSYNHRGRWVVAPGANSSLLADVQQALRRTCAFNSSLSHDTFFGCPMGMLPAVVPEAEDHPVLEWTPYDCRCGLQPLKFHYHATAYLSDAAAVREPAPCSALACDYLCIISCKMRTVRST